MRKRRKKLVINRRRWLRKKANGKFHGSPRGLSALNMNGYRCCLGFYCEQFHDKTLEDLGFENFPYILDIDVDLADWQRKVASINDRGSHLAPKSDGNISVGASDSEQEVQIAQEFKEALGITVEFVN